MTPFEEQLKAIFDAYNGLTIDTEEAAKLHSYVLTKLAMQEACSKCKFYDVAFRSVYPVGRTTDNIK